MHVLPERLLIAMRAREPEIESRGSLQCEKTVSNGELHERRDREGLKKYIKMRPSWLATEAINERNEQSYHDIHFTAALSRLFHFDSAGCNY